MSPAIFSFIRKKWDLGRFRNIKITLNGKMSAEAYAAIYDYASKAPDGTSMIEIGSGQGAATVALGLAIKESHTQGRIYAFEKCEKSAALQSWSRKRENLNVLKANVKRHGLEHLVTIIPENVYDDGARILGQNPFSLLLIDSDGAIDRVFELFYNALMPGSVIIIDDYENKINLPPDIRDMRYIPEYLASKGRSHLRELCPLGKHYTTFKLVNYFLDEALIERREIIGNTFVGMKPSIQNPVQWDRKAIRAIRENILEEYYHCIERHEFGGISDEA